MVINNELIILSEFTGNTHNFFGDVMTYKLPTYIMLITLAFAIILMVSSFPPAIAETEITSNNSADIKAHVDANEGFTQANQIKVLIAAVGLLFFGYMWWVQKYIERNDKKHSAHNLRADVLEGKINHTTESLKEMMGAHQMSMQLRGCAADSNKLREVIAEALAPINLFLHQRNDDPKEILTVTSRGPAATTYKEIEHD